MCTLEDGKSGIRKPQTFATVTFVELQHDDSCVVQVKLAVGFHLASDVSGIAYTSHYVFG